MKSNIIMHLKNLGNSIETANNINNIINNIASEKEQLVAFSEIAQKSSTEVLKLASSQVTLTKAQATAIFTAKGLSGAELDAAVKTATLSASQKEATTSTLGLNVAAKGLWATMVAHPILSISAGIGVLIGLYTKCKQVQEDNRKAAQDIESTL